MANRPISPISTIPLVSPGATLTTTAWNTAANTMNGVHEVGGPPFIANSRHINGARRPIVGDSGISFTEVASQEVSAIWELPGGYSRLLIMGNVDLDTTGGQTVRIKIDGITYLSVNSPLGVSDIYQIVPILAGQLTNPGLARTVRLSFESEKTSPSARSGLPIGYRDGLVSVFIKPIP